MLSRTPGGGEDFVRYDLEGGASVRGAASRATCVCRRVLLGVITAVAGLVGLGCQSLQVIAPPVVLDAAWPDVLAVGETFGDSAAAPAYSRIEVGRSFDGAPIEMSVFGSGPDTVLVLGGTHGNEPVGAIVAAELERYLSEHPDELAGTTVAIVAQVNPDGLKSGRRTNANGVDLNRNFPARDWRPAQPGELHHGLSAASEPETQAVLTAIELLRPRRIVDIHSIQRGHHCNNFDGPAEEHARLMSRFNGYPSRSHIGYPTPGSLGNWAGIDQGIPTITLELPGDVDGARCWEENADALLAFIEAGDGANGR